MLLKARDIQERIEKGFGDDNDNPLIISPRESLGELGENGAASVDLRLGAWFTSLEKNSCPVAAVNLQTSDALPTDQQYVPFGGVYVLHPGCFVLGVTLEWMRIPTDLGGYVNGKSSWGRRGLVIATAAVVHPGFKGCLTLELANIGEIPIELSPGMKICQLSLHEANVTRSQNDNRQIIDKSTFIGMRKPGIGKVKHDVFSEILSKKKKET